MTEKEIPDVKSIFGNAASMESPDERADYLDQACGDNAALRAEVEDLLARPKNLEAS